MKHWRVAGLAAAAWVLSACSNGNRVLEPEFSEVSGETTVRVERAIVYARPQSGLAAQGREYLYLGPVETDRFGQLLLELWVGVGSTAAAAPQRQTAVALALEVDGQRHELPLVPDSAPVYPVPVPVAESYRAPLTGALLVALADAEQVAVSLERRGLSHPYGHWHGNWPRWDHAGETLGVGIRARVNELD